MTEWRELILKRFVPNVARVTAVSDEDGLLRDPGVFQAIEAKGFALVRFEDSVSFRFDYESRFRSKWDAGRPLELVVYFKPEEREFETLPADVLANAQRLSFTLKDVFPKLSYTVVSELEVVYFDALYRAQQQYASQVLGDALTRDFVLQHVFGIVPSVIKTVPDLLRMLCQRHYGKVSIPQTLDDHLVGCLLQNPNFRDWPLKIIVPNRAVFWEFLNERWPIFVCRTNGSTAQITEDSPPLKYPGPELLPFDHDEVRIYIHNLFEDGLLTPVEWDWNQALDKKWIKVGLLGNKTENTDLRFEELRENLLKGCPDVNATAKQWLGYAFRYAQANLLWTQTSPAIRTSYQRQLPELRGFVNEHFFEWLAVNYGGLFNYPSSSPLMVNHIPGFLAHQVARNSSQRVAFILIDGLAIDQWLVLRDSLKAQGLVAPIEEDALFAWIPTITPISRQAAFSGKIPRYFADTIGRTDRDEARWRQFWSDRGLPAVEVGFVTRIGNLAEIDTIGDCWTPQTRVLGMTIFKIDKIMHGMQLGSVGMTGQVRTWVEEGFFFQLLERLVANGFNVFISSDHGNTEALGIGTPQEGVLSDTRGQRCRIYSDALLRKGCLTVFPESILWDNAGLPEGISSLLAPQGKAFVQVGSTIVCHGGATLEEVCVPFVTIAAKS